MKKIVMISGPPGVGKTTISKAVFESIEGCAWLDGDWCWMVNPWVPKNKDEKKVVEETFRRIIQTYIDNESINTIIFNWVMKANWMFDLITEDIDNQQFIIKKIVLVCDRKDHIQRLSLDGRRKELIDHPEDMDRYKNLDAHIVNVTNDTIENNVKKVMDIIEA